MGLIVTPHVVWLVRSGADPLAGISLVPSALVSGRRLMAWGNLLLLLVLAHVGLVILILVAGGLFTPVGAHAPAIEREPIDPSRGALCSSSRSRRPSSQHCSRSYSSARRRLAAPRRLSYSRGLPSSWRRATSSACIASASARWRALGLLLVPPAVIVFATVTLPWTAAVDLEVSKPANAMGQAFTETFRRRTGKPLAIVVGDARTAGLVAFASPDRPRLYLDGSPARAVALG